MRQKGEDILKKYNNLKYWDGSVRNLISESQFFEILGMC